MISTSDKLFPVIALILLAMIFSGEYAQASKCDESIFIEATGRNDLKLVKECLQQGVDVNSTIGRQTALQLAAANGFNEVAKVLLEAKANPDIVSSGYSPLILAVWNYRTKIVQLLIDANVNVDAQDIYGQTPLMYAVKNSDSEITTLLIKAKANLNLQDRLKKQTALIIATIVGNSDIVNILISVKANPDIQDVDGLSALMIACLPHKESKNYLAIIRFLIAGNARQDLRDKSNRTALMLAAKTGLNDVVNLLLSGGTAVDLRDSNGETALFYAINGGNLSAVVAILNANANANLQNDKGRTPLMAASSAREPEILKVIINANVDINAQDRNGETALMLAMDVACVKILINAKSELDLKNLDGFTALMFHIELNNLSHIDIAKELIAAGAQLNCQSNFKKETALMLAISGYSHESFDLAISLIDAGANVNLQNRDGETALYLAIKGGIDNAVYALISAHADVNLYRYTPPLIKAVEFGIWLEKYNIIKALIDAGSELNARDNFNRTALIKAASGISGSNNKPTAPLKMLIDAHANLDFQDEVGGHDGGFKSALIYAVKSQSFERVKLLTEAGARLDLKDGAGKTAYYYAELLSDQSIAKYLKSHGG